MNANDRKHRALRSFQALTSNLGDRALEKSWLTVDHGGQGTLPRGTCLARGGGRLAGPIAPPLHASRASLAARRACAAYLQEKFAASSMLPLPLY